MSKNTSSKGPSHRLFAVKDRGEDKPADWIEIGAAWPHQDKQGFSLRLKIPVPPDTELLLRTVKAKAKGGAA